MWHWLKFWHRRRKPRDAQPCPSPATKPVEAVPPPPLSDISSDLSPEHAALLQALEDPSPTVRGPAIEDLIRVGAPVVPALAARLGHGEACVRQAAVLALGDIGLDAAQALTALVRAAVDRDDGVRRTASTALARVDPAWAIAPGTRLALPAVIEALRSNLPRVSRAAHTLLLRIGRPAVPALLDLLAEWEEQAHRLTAMGLLGQMGSSAGEAAPALAELLGSGDPQLRQAAAETLARLEAAAAPAVPALIRVLADWSPPVRQAAAEALSAVGPAAAHAVPSLLGMLADWDDKARAAAVAALGGIGAPAVPLLVLVFQERELFRLRDRPSFREEVDRLWRQLDTVRGNAVPDRAWRQLTWAARAGLRERTEVVHVAAATALGRAGPAAVAAVPILVPALADERPAVRLAVARALGAIGPSARTALPPLAAVVVNGTEPLRTAAAEALSKIDADWDGGSEAATVVPALVARLTENSPRGAEAADALALIGEAAAPLLVGALVSEDRAVSEAAAHTLGRIGPAARYAVPALTAALRDPRDEVREAAARALAKVVPGRG